MNYPTAQEITVPVPELRHWMEATLVNLERFKTADAFTHPDIALEVYIADGKPAWRFSVWTGSVHCYAESLAEAEQAAIDKLREASAARIKTLEDELEHLRAAMDQSPEIRLNVA